MFGWLILVPDFLSHILSPCGQPEGPSRGCGRPAFSTVHYGLVNKIPKHPPPTASGPQERQEGVGSHHSLPAMGVGGGTPVGLASNNLWQLPGV